MAKRKILFLCTGNSCRSQMAEGWARYLLGDELEAFSAGIEAHGLNARAVKVMAESGVDISGQRSKTIEELGDIEFDAVVTVCDRARESCPIFTGKALKYHSSFDDPPRLAEGTKTEDEALFHYRRVRDEIRAFVETLPSILKLRDEREIDMGRGLDKLKEEAVRGTVREAYGRIARRGESCCGQTTCCGGQTSEAVASTLGYGDEELAGLPDGANLGLSCGNPTAIASLTPGETVVDLGAGGGFDAFIAARKVGPYGLVIGVDMTPEMVERARLNAESFTKSTGLTNVEFRLGEIEHLPVADASVDVVISNCVINLSPDKAQVWREIERVLKPGGRVSVSDLALQKPLPDAIKDSLTALVGCIAGAVLIDDTRGMVDAAGLVEAVFETRSDYIDQMADWSDPLYREIIDNLPPQTRPGDYITSLNISAKKPGRPM